MTDSHFTYWEIFADEVLRLAAISLGHTAEDGTESIRRLPSFKGSSGSRTVDRELSKAISAFGKAIGDDVIGRWGRLISGDAETMSRTAPLLALLGAAETSISRRHVITSIGGSNDGSWTFGALQLALPHAVQELTPHAPLSKAGFIDVSDNGPWSRRAVWLAPVLTWQLRTSAAARDPDIPETLERLNPRDPAVSNERLVLVAGPDPLSRKQRAADLLGGAEALVVPVGEPSSRGDPDAVKQTTSEPNKAQWTAIIREATLTNSAIIVDLTGPLSPTLRALVQVSDNVRWGISSLHHLSISEIPDRPWLEDTLAPTDDASGFPDAVEMGQRTSFHRLTHTQRHQIHQVIPHLGGDVSSATRRLISGEIDQLAVRINPQKSWDDLVLPQNEFNAVRHIADRYRQRVTVLDQWGFGSKNTAGIIALLSGPPGTGKTLSAEVVCRDLEIDLFRVNIASMVSKYIGETEKNLERLFNAAETGTIALLFDEADSLFGRRGEVAKSTDRYANLEVSYLLQRIEAFGGLVFLTSNLQGNIDPAFMRRIQLAITFERPERPERTRLWRLAIPSGAPTEGIDIEFLAGLELTGAEIMNVATGAAFHAATDQSAISMRYVIRALQEETTKQGRLLDRRHLDAYAHFII